MVQSNLVLVNAIKMAALECVEHSNPVAVNYGVVTSVEPLKIKVDQKLVLTRAQLVLTRNVTDYEILMEVEHNTESASGGSGYGQFDRHSPGYNGEKIFRVKNGLKVGEEVVLVRVSGGQKFIVFDRVGK